MSTEPVSSEIGVQPATFTTNDGIVRNAWAVQIDSRWHVDPVELIHAADGEIRICDERYDYSLPCILSRSAGPEVVWMANPRLGELPLFSEKPAFVMRWSQYCEALGCDPRDRPPLLSEAELQRLLDDLLQRLPGYEKAEYGIPDYEGDDSGRRLLVKLQRMMSLGQCRVAESHEPLLPQISYEIGVRDGEEVSIDAIPEIGAWRIVRPTAFPVWLVETATSSNP